MKACTRCLYNDSFPGIEFGPDGECSYCYQHDSLCEKFPGSIQGEAVFIRRVAEIKRNRSGEFDCIVGVSGGCDSSYMLDQCVKHGLRCLAVHADNGWNTEIAESNMKAVTGALNVLLEVVRVDPAEYDSMVRAFLDAGLPDIEAPADMGLASVLYRAASRYNCKYIMEGHNFRTEGISPLGWLYMDSKYVLDVCEKYGRWPLKTYKGLMFWDMVKFMGLGGIEKVRPLYNLTYNKKSTKAYLKGKFGWQDYGVHHGENRLTAYYHDVFMPKHYGVNTRVLGWSALIRSGQMSREEGIEKMKIPGEVSQEIHDEIDKRLGVSMREFKPERTSDDFKNYKKTFRRTWPLWWLLWKMGRVSDSFISKWCGVKI